MFLFYINLQIFFKQKNCFLIKKYYWIIIYLFLITYYKLKFFIILLMPSHLLKSNLRNKLH